jgi:hypothetical protein
MDINGIEMSEHDAHKRLAAQVSQTKRLKSTSLPVDRLLIVFPSLSWHRRNQTTNFPIRESES